MPLHNTTRAYIYIYEGTQGSYTSDDLKYRITKDRIPSHDDIVLEIGEMVSDYITQTYNGTVYNTKPVWVTVVAQLYDENDAILPGSPKTYNYLALDGYGYFEEGINPELDKVVLQSNEDIYVEEGTSATVAVWAEGQPTITLYSSSGSTIGTLTVQDNGNSNQKVQYVTFPSNCTKAIVDAADEETTLNINYVCENVYTPYLVTFLNRYGVLQGLTFFKKSVENMAVQDETFKGNILNVASKNYSINEGQRTRYNVNAQDSITLNTGYVDEDFNEAIEQLLLAQKVWIKYGSETLPVLPTTKTMQYKTEVNDKLINYTINFDFAFDKVNLVR